MSLKLPSIDEVTTINRDGSHYFLHPADVSGRFTVARRVFALLLIGLYVALPWISVNGFPAVFLDVRQRSFHLLGFTFAPQDLWLGFFAISGLGFSLFYATALFGRLWCGWACPYTVFLEHVYRRVERWIDGDAPERRRLEAAPWTPNKTLRRVAKHGLYGAISLVIAHVFMSYFVSLPRLWSMMADRPGDHLLAFGIVMFLTFALYGAFAWFREQFCIILCPYGRIQSALTDDNTMVIGYDTARGEPRGARGREGSTGAGDCINCLRCVQVCPTGIDIRNGLQLECVGCASCVDACDAVMQRLGRPAGLVRYASMNALAGKRTAWLRPRVYLYTILLITGLLALGFSLTRLRPFQLTFVRLPGAAYYVDPAKNVIRNQFQVRLINKRMQPQTFVITLEGAPAGTTLSGPEAHFQLGPQEQRIVVTTVEIPRASYRGHQPLALRITSEPGAQSSVKKFEFTGPDPRLLDESFLQP
jgi:cytochrome c oxidase accessory protein FixG